MRFVDRTKELAPDWLMTPSAPVAQERSDAETYYALGKVKSAFPFNEYKNYAVGLALTKLFAGKCAYCESEVGAPNDEEIEHYRPKGGIADDALHDGYWWVASDWSNLLLSCTGCNQGRKQHLITAEMKEEDYLAQIAAPPRTKVGKLQQFPIGGKRAIKNTCELLDEDPHLIDPTTRDPQGAFKWSTSSAYSIVLPALKDGVENPYGAATIKVCALNRSKLVKARTKLLKQLRRIRNLIFERLHADSGPGGIGAALIGAEMLRTFADEDQPYSAMAQAYVDEVGAELGEWLAKHKGDHRS
jgi:uncharacterized protein (TIGR02646 family)